MKPSCEALRIAVAEAAKGIELPENVIFSPAARAFVAKRDLNERRMFCLRKKLAMADAARELNIQRVRAERWAAGEEVGKNAPSTIPASKRRRPLNWDDEDDDGDDDDGDVGGAGGDAPAPAEDVGGAGDA